MSIVLETKSLVKDYGGKVALSGIDLSLPSGKIIGLLGSNGSGKTTLLKLASGLLQPTSGEIRVCGMEIGVETKRLVSFLPERTYLNDWMRVMDIMEYFADFYEDFDKEAAHHMLVNLGVNEKDRLKTLSKESSICWMNRLREWIRSPVNIFSIPLLPITIRKLLLSFPRI